MLADHPQYANSAAISNRIGEIALSGDAFFVRYDRWTGSMYYIDDAVGEIVQFDVLVGLDPCSLEVPTHRRHPVGDAAVRDMLRAIAALMGAFIFEYIFVTVPPAQEPENEMPDIVHILDGRLGRQEVAQVEVVLVADAMAQATAHARLIAERHNVTEEMVDAVVNTLQGEAAISSVRAATNSDPFWYWGSSSAGSSRKNLANDFISGEVDVTTSTFVIRSVGVPDVFRDLASVSSHGAGNMTATLRDSEARICPWVDTGPAAPYFAFLPMALWEQPAGPRHIYVTFADSPSQFAIGSCA